MARYIDADALKDDISSQLKACKYIFGNSFAEEIEASMVGLYMTIDRQPTADVVEVVRGAWLNTTHGLKCSNCEFISPYNNRYFNFCPMCGADMRGGTE